MKFTRATAKPFKEWLSKQGLTPFTVWQEKLWVQKIEKCLLKSEEKRDEFQIGNRMSCACPCRL